MKIDDKTINLGNLPEGLKNLYQKATRGKGSRHINDFNTSASRSLDRLISSLDLIVKEVAEVSKLDLEAEIPGPSFSNDKILLFTAFLVASHPKIITVIQEIREKIGLSQFLDYTKVYDPEDGDLSNTTLNTLNNSLKEKLDTSLNIFFAGVGKNLGREDWERQISTFILTDVLPLPFMPFAAFQINRNQNKAEIHESMQYPTIVIKKRIKLGELNQFIEFIRDNDYELERATRHLPSAPVKRVDADVTRLAIGLWVYKNEGISNEGLEMLIQEKEAVDENYFGKYKHLGSDELPNFKSDALGYLNQLYPLKP